jgi:hypothetical protein
MLVEKNLFVIDLDIQLLDIEEVVLDGVDFVLDVVVETTQCFDKTVQ